MFKKIIILILPVVDLFVSIFVLISSILLKLIRVAGIQRFRISKLIFRSIGVFPIIDHYYEPIFNSKKLSKPLSTQRDLPGINFNTQKQLDIIEKLNFSSEFYEWVDSNTKNDFFFGNGSFESGDAEYLYNFVRYFKPKKIIEIGCGYSSLIIKKAIEKNQDDNIICEQICIEPYEVKWLESKNIRVLREIVENIDRRTFRDLNAGDLLFIDSSHIIRPQGDVIYEYLEILPILKKGVYVHIHDIFTPNDYPFEWQFNQVKLWNEQYLVEAFLTHNDSWEITGALNYLNQNYFSQLKNIAYFHDEKRQPGSLYLKKIK